MPGYLDALDKMETTTSALRGVGHLLRPDMDLDARARDDLTLLISVLVGQFTSATDEIHEVFKLMKDYAPSGLKLADGVAQDRKGESNVG
ncbi:hypothetical protein Dalk_4776 [Desulfatibacillum aliphaticivorans]|uniref:Uncharacterized protein n=1 Tax=Desulfatibacillum aliphaticivorans TaxID=218208 RepID=B8FD23_DESAL|nr:hypothetical protein [Desulfatibacillum aliphaticivorans]ACL06454.1 hypothetical protein Dalk_4776 [Desulfatibacillum aliphaticivorans]